MEERLIGRADVRQTDATAACMPHVASARAHARAGLRELACYDALLSHCIDLFSSDSASVRSFVACDQSISVPNKSSVLYCMETSRKIVIKASRPI